MINNCLKRGEQAMKSDLYLSAKRRFVCIFSALVFVCLLPLSVDAIDDPRFSPYMEQYPYGWIDWHSKMIYGTGRGYLHHNGGMKNRAMRAAKVVALQSILKVAAGVRLDDKTTLEALGKGSVVIHLKAMIRFSDHKSAFIQNIAQPYFEVTLKAPLTGVSGLTSRLLTQLKSMDLNWRSFPRQAPGQRTGPGETSETWLILDGRTLPGQGKIVPALFPKIMSRAGDTLYQLEDVNEEAVVERGMATYVESSASIEELHSHLDSKMALLSQIVRLFSIRDAMAQSKRKKRRRFIIKEVEQAKGLAKTNLVVSDSDARELKAEDAASRILKDCRVVVVVSSPIGGVEGGRHFYFAQIGETR
jgi:hypothetical protein